MATPARSAGAVADKDAAEASSLAAAAGIDGAGSAGKMNPTLAAHFATTLAERKALLARALPAAGLPADTPLSAQLTADQALRVGQAMRAHASTSAPAGDDCLSYLPALVLCLLFGFGCSLLYIFHGINVLEVAHHALVFLLDPTAGDESAGASAAAAAAIADDSAPAFAPTFWSLLSAAFLSLPTLTPRTHAPAPPHVVAAWEGLIVETGERHGKAAAAAACPDASASAASPPPLVVAVGARAAAAAMRALSDARAEGVAVAETAAEECARAAEGAVREAIARGVVSCGGESAGAGGGGGGGTAAAAAAGDNREKEEL